LKKVKFDELKSTCESDLSQFENVNIAWYFSWLRRRNIWNSSSWKPTNL